MADNDSHSGEFPTTTSILYDLMTRITEALSKASTFIPTTNSRTAPIGIKLDDMNYAIWSQVLSLIAHIN